VEGDEKRVGFKWAQSFGLIDMVALNDDGLMIDELETRASRPI
jgi:hypothetical protein